MTESGPAPARRERSASVVWVAAGLFLSLVLASPVRSRAQSNQAPTPVGTIDDRTLAPDADAVTLDVADAFSDPDNDPLTYSAESGDSDRLTVGVADSTLTLTPAAPGRVVVTVTATDQGGLSAAQRCRGCWRRILERWPRLGFHRGESKQLRSGFLWRGVRR